MWPAAPVLIATVLGCPQWAGGAEPSPATNPAPLKLTAVRLGEGARHDPSLLSQPEAGAVVVKGAGREAYMGRDEGTFACVQTAAASFTFEARIRKAPTGTPNPKYGLSVREGLEGTDRCLEVRYDGYEGNRCIQWLLRHHYAPGAHDGSRRCFIDGLQRDMTRAEGFWLRIERRYPQLRCYLSDDGQTWKPVGGGYSMAMLAQKVRVGMQVTAGGDGRKQVEVAFDRVRFVEHPAGPEAVTRQVYQEYLPRPETWQMHLIQAKTGRGRGNPAAAFLLKPKSMEAKSIRAVLLTAGCKEEVVAGRQLAWESKKPALRRPKQMKDWQGVLEIEDIAPFNQVLRHYGIVRVGGVFHAWHYRDVVRELAEFTGIRHLPNVPVMITGASFAGGHTAHAARAMPELTIAAAPVIIGMAGANTEDRAVLQVPHMHIYGSIDGRHMRDAEKWTPILRKGRALWANAPMWMVAHRQHKANALIYPFFLEAMRLRVPAGADFTKGPVKLKTLKEADGWVGLTDTWRTNCPKVAPFRDYKGDPGRAVWLPSEKAARVWQAFVSFDPRTVILFPTYDGSETYGGLPPRQWHNSCMEADKPFELLAIGPLGKGLKVQYYSGTRRIRKLGGGNYRVRLEGLPPGLHSIYAVTEVDGRKEISRPVLVMFRKRRRSSTRGARPARTSPQGEDG
jgi:hypothetical protein